MGVFHMSEENMLPMSLLLDSVLAGAAAGAGAAFCSGSAAGLPQLKPLNAGALGACKAHSTHTQTCIRHSSSHVTQSCCCMSTTSSPGW
jgi:hypothetical protein